MTFMIEGDLKMVAVVVVAVAAIQHVSLSNIMQLYNLNIKVKILQFSGSYLITQINQNL